MRPKRKMDEVDIGIVLFLVMMLFLFVAGGYAFYQGVVYNDGHQFYFGIIGLIFGTILTVITISFLKK